MLFRFSLMNVELFSFEFIMPSRGIYEVPEEIPSEWELDEIESFFAPDDTEDDE